MKEAMPTPARPRARVSRIVLTGFMGAGKTTAGALAAQRLGWIFADSDRVVEARAGMKIAQIFAECGEAAFREMEAAAIRETALSERMVLALGGGALETAATRDFLAALPETLTVFLDAPLETLVERCSGHANGPVRPVLADRERLAARWRTRLPWYREAHLTIDTRERTPEAVAEAIVAAASEPREVRV